MTTDEKWMRHALRLARRGMGFTHPNPMVGAVLVRNGRLIAEGYHRAYGNPHAEVEAIRRAGRHARGATLYVTLEPCAHWGKTPPCANAVVAAGIKRVVAAIKDPNPKVAGKGFSTLRRGRVRTDVGICREEAIALNRAFLKRMQTGLPYVTAKIASSLDGRTATVTGESKWITSAVSRQAGHRLRAEFDAIAVGAGTVLKDNPTLSAHGQGRNPVRIVFAGRRKLSPRARIFNSAAPTWVLRGARGKKQLLRHLRDLSRRGITHLLVEGGPTLQRSFIDAGVVDEVIWFIAPIILGTQPHLRQAIRLKGVSDLCVRAEVGR